jgi:hypothetical protein
MVNVVLVEVLLGARSCPSTRASNVVMREGLFCLDWLGQSLTHSHSSAYGWIYGGLPASTNNHRPANRVSGPPPARLWGGLDAELRPALVTASRDKVIEWSRTVPCRAFCIARYCDRMWRYCDTCCLLSIVAARVHANKTEH